MKTMHYLKRISGISLVMGLLLLALLPSCGKKGKDSNVFVERISQLDESMLAMLDSYTSGVIAAGEPVVVRFSNPEELKVKFGEPIPAKAFEFAPALKGKAMWIDENTVGFQYDNIDKDQNYVCRFKMADFVDVAPDKVLEFGFGVRRQNFSLVTMQPICTSNEEMSYNIRLAFATPIDQAEAVKLFDESFRKDHPVEVSYVGNNVFDFLVQGLKREASDYQLPLTLDGKPIDCKAKMQRELTVYAKDGFKPLLFDVDNAANKAALFFSQPLKEDQNLDGFVTFNKALGYKADIKGNQIDFYFDKSSLNNYELSELNMTVGSGIRAANGMLMQSDYPFDFDLTDNLPKVRWTDDGVIIPKVEETTVYFDAICLNAVTLRIVRVFDDNILSFMQDNELSETYGIRKAGRLEKKVRLAIDNPYANQWKTFPIVLSDYVKVEPGAMYQLSLNFGPADYTFASEEMKQAVVENEKREAEYWDGNRYDYKEYRYERTDTLGNVYIDLNHNIKSQRSIHAIVGGDYTFRALNRPFKFTTEIYYKNLANLIPYEVDNLKVVYSGLNQSKGYVAGIDLKLFGQFVEGTDSWISFSLMKTQETLNGVKVPRPTDQRYSFALFFTDYFPKLPRLKFSLKAIVSDGLPTTSPRMTRDQSYFRQPAYKRVDVGLSFQLVGGQHRPTTGFLSHFKSIWLGVDVFNLFDISNVSSYYWITDVNAIQYAVPNYLTRRQINARLQLNF